MEIGQASSECDVAAFARGNDEGARMEAVNDPFDPTSGDNNFLHPTAGKVPLVGHVETERLHDVTQARCGEARLEWYGGQHGYPRLTTGSKFPLVSVGLLTGEYVDQHAGDDRWMVAALRILMKSEVKGTRGASLEIRFGDYRDQSRREAACHRGVELCGDLQVGHRDEARDHNDVCAGTCLINEGDNLLKKSIEVARSEAFLGDRKW
jgi:hypothetical protein